MTFQVGDIWRFFWVNGKTPQGRGGLTYKSTWQYLNVGFVREDVGEVEVVCDPIHGNASDSALADTILNIQSSKYGECYMNS